MMARRDPYEIEDLKRAAAGRWPELLERVGGIPAEALDGRHHACPKCGGTDRFRFIDPDAGAVLCNQCFAERNGDGLAALQWSLDADFSTTKRLLQEYLGLPVTNGHASNGNDHKSNGSNGHAKKSTDGSLWEKLDLVKVDGIAARWAKSLADAKPGVSADALLRAGLRPVRFAGLGGCCAFPVVDPETLDRDNPLGILLYRNDGSLFPAVGKLSERKTHLVAGSHDGWIIVGSADELRAAATAWKCEGLTDAAALACILPAGHIAITSGCGAGSFKTNLATVLKGKNVPVVHDADEPGQRGAKKAVKVLSKAEATAGNVVLFDEIHKNHGPDLRDWLNAGGIFAALESLAAAAMTSTASDQPKGEPKKTDGVTNALAFAGKDEDWHEPMTVCQVVTNLDEMTDGWPRRIGSSLFVDDKKHGVADLKTPAALFGWANARTGKAVTWHRGEGYVTKEELFAELQRTAKAYTAVEWLPHEPPIAGHYYVCGEIKSGDGSTLAELIGRFNPATEIDADLLKAAFATLFWGGPGGARPCFNITSDDGRGVGKSTVAGMIARLAGGSVELSANEPTEKIKERLLSGSGLRKRVALLDNLKSLRFSWADLEGLITSPEISGKQLYVGEASRPNCLTWVVTLNGISLATDMAQRAVIVKLSRPRYEGNWTEDTNRFIDSNRDAIVADCIGFLRGAINPLEKNSRWGSWEKSVLCRLPEPEEAQRVILDRQGVADVEREEAEIVEDFFADQLQKLRYSTATDKIHIPTAIATRWFNWATNEKHSPASVSRIINQKCSEGAMKRLSPNPSRANGRGVLWIGEQYSGTNTFIDVEFRISETAKRREGAYGWLGTVGTPLGRFVGRFEMQFYREKTAFGTVGTLYPLRRPF